MGILNKDQVDALFRREAVMLGSEDRVPEYRVAAIFGKGAVEHAHRLDRGNPGRYASGYGVGDYTLDALTFKGFQAAASFYNVQQLREEAVAYEKEMQK